MQKIVLSALVYFWIIQSACVTSLNPLVTYDRAITDEKLSGTWKKSDGQEFLIQPVLKSDFYKHHQDKDDIKKESKEDSLLLARSYILEYDKECGHYTLLISFIRLNGQLFMNCLPIEGTYNTHAGGGVDLTLPGSMPGYTIAKVLWQNSNT